MRDVCVQLTDVSHEAIVQHHQTNRDHIIARSALTHTSTVLSQILITFLFVSRKKFSTPTCELKLPRLASAVFTDP